MSCQSGQYVISVWLVDQTGEYVMSVWSVCHVWLEFLISLVYMSCESGYYVMSVW